MNRLQGSNLRVVFYEGPGTKPAADRAATLSALLDAGFEVSRPAAGRETSKPFWRRAEIARYRSSDGSGALPGPS